MRRSMTIFAARHEAQNRNVLSFPSKAVRFPNNSPSAALFVDIASSRNITAPYCISTVLPMVREQLRKRRVRAAHLQTQPIMRPPSAEVRCVVFSPLSPQLQDSTWSDVWQAYVRTVSSSPTPCQDRALEVWGEPSPLIGSTAKVPVLLKSSKAGGEELWVEGVRVDAYITVREQMCVSLRHVLRRRRWSWQGAAAAASSTPMAVMALVVPDHVASRYEAFLLAEAAENKRVAAQDWHPVEVLLFDSKGLPRLVVEL